MSKLDAKIRAKGSVLAPPPPISPLPSFPSHSTSNSSQSGSKISPVVLLVIIILAIIFFVSGVLHLLVRFLMKRPSFYSSVSHSNRYHENPSSDALQRQLQQLFRLHDSGLDQALIDALPVFYYTDIMGLKEPFDCAVCLCEFSDQDKLRLLPLCSHAFHISCIDTWLLSNSTCPLCRGSLLTSGLENQEFSLDYWRELSFGCSIDGENRTLGNNTNVHSFHPHNSNYKPTIMEECASERRVFSVRLGKFRSSNNNGGTAESENGETSTSSSSQLDARRCYSLGSCQYVLADSNLQVALSAETGSSDCGIKLEKMVDQIGNASVVDGDLEGKKIRRNKGDSFSVSKIWLWSKKGRFPGSSETNLNVAGAHPPPPPLNVILPLSSRDQIFH